MTAVSANEIVVRAAKLIRRWESLLVVCQEATEGSEGTPAFHSGTRPADPFGRATPPYSLASGSAGAAGASKR